VNHLAPVRSGLAGPHRVGVVASVSSSARQDDASRARRQKQVVVAVDGQDVYGTLRTRAAAPDRIVGTLAYR